MLLWNLIRILLMFYSFISRVVDLNKTRIFSAELYLEDSECYVAEYLGSS